MINFPPVVTFRITSKCNNDCKYCFVPQNIEEMNLLKLKKLFHLLHLRGVKAILLTGGEPLLRDDFREIISELKKYNFKIFLDTNGDLFFKYKNLISKHIDVIGLPIDFPNSSYRGKNNLKVIIKILNHFKRLKKRPIIRIGTVVTKDNFKELYKIGELLKNYPVDIWKLYQFQPVENSNSEKNKFFLQIPQKEFDKITEKIKNTFSKFFKIVISSRKNRNHAYFFVGSDGIVFMPVDDLNIGKDKIIGNVFDYEIIEKWMKVISKENYKKNIKVTFNYKF